MTRSELKSIVKECLLEILNEGLKSAQHNVSEAKRQPIIQRPRQQVQRQNKPTEALKEAIKREAGGDPVMEAILADTAKNTLPSMLNNDSPVPTQPLGAVEEIVSKHTPEQLFGEETTSKWAFLAFNDDSPGKN
jgi:hypothetical protein